ncbi:MAG: hypothetical protein ACPGU1_22560 [Myxococcota bacterium]
MRRLFITAIAGLSLVSAACANPKPVTDSPTETAETADSQDAKEAPSDCVQTCTDARRAEAMDWSVIVSECEASCAER